MKEKSLLRAKRLLSAGSILSLLVAQCIPMQALALTASDFVNNQAPAATFKPSDQNKLVYDITVPDAMNGVGFEDDLITEGSEQSWGGDTLVPFNPAVPDMEVFLDQIFVGFNEYENGEDILRMVIDGTDNYVDGSQMQALGTNELSYFNDGISNTTPTADYNTDEAIVRDTDADGHPSSGDVIVTSGKGNMREIQASDGLCFDGSVANDGEYDPNEVVWYDIAGNCASFDTGVDVILVGNTVPTGTQTNAANDHELGYIDANLSAFYSCSRVNLCEPIVFSGADGFNIVNGAYMSPTYVFFDSSTNATDGIAVTGTGWDEVGGLEAMTDFAAAPSRFGYIGSGPYTDGDDFFKLIRDGGASTTFQDADEVRLFNPIMNYVDTDGSTNYTNEEDIYYDSGSNATKVDKKADELRGITIDNLGTAVNAGDIQAVEMWVESGVTPGFQSASDTNLGNMTAIAGAFVKSWRRGGLNTAIPANGLRVYFTVDLTPTAMNGNTLQFSVPTYFDAAGDKAVNNDADKGFFPASVNIGPTDFVITNTATQTIDSFPPQSVLVHIASNGSPTNQAVPGNTVTINFNANEAINTPVVVARAGGVIVNGPVVVSNVGGNNYTAAFVMNAADTAGPITFTVDFTDLAGNAGTQVTTTNDTSTVTFVNTPVSSGGGGGGSGGSAMFGRPASSGTGATVPTPDSSTPTETNNGFFTDTNGHWAHDYAEKLHTECGVEGYKDANGKVLHLYKANNPITRAELIKLLVQCEYGELPAVSFTTFTDVNASHWGAAYIAKAKQLGWASGYADGTFKPDQNVNRAEALKMILLSKFDAAMIGNGTANFQDSESGAWYEKYLSFAVSKGIATGYKDSKGVATGFFGTNDSLLRGEAAKMISVTNGW